MTSSKLTLMLQASSLKLWTWKKTMNHKSPSKSNQIQADISVINSEQNIQDAQLLEMENSVENIEVELARIGELETSLRNLNETVGELSDDLQKSVTTLEETDVVTEDVEGLTATTDDLLVSVVSLQETDAEVMDNIAQLIETNSNLDARLSKLEVDRTFGFHADLGPYTSIPLGSVVVFPIVNVILGNGYNSETGNFVTPLGGAGLYFFYTHFQLQRGEYVQIDIRVNGMRLAQMVENDGNANGYPGGSCGAAVVLDEGK